MSIQIARMPPESRFYGRAYFTPHGDLRSIHPRESARYRAGDDASRVSPAIPKQQFATEASSSRSDSRPHRLGDWVGPRPPRSRARAQRFVFELGDQFAGSGRHGSAQAARAQPPGSGSSTSWKRSRSKRLQPARPVRPQISNRPRADRGRRTLPTRSHRRA